MYVLQFLLRVRLHFFDYLAHIILPEMVYTVVLSILLTGFYLSSTVN